MREESEEDFEIDSSFNENEMFEEVNEINRKVTEIINVHLTDPLNEADMVTLPEQKCEIDDLTSEMSANGKSRSHSSISNKESEHNERMDSMSQTTLDAVTITDFCNNCSAKLEKIQVNDQDLHKVIDRTISLSNLHTPPNSRGSNDDGSIQNNNEESSLEIEDEIRPYLAKQSNVGSTDLPLDKSEMDLKEKITDNLLCRQCSNPSIINENLNANDLHNISKQVLNSSSFISDIKLKQQDYSRQISSSGENSGSRTDSGLMLSDPNDTPLSLEQDALDKEEAFDNDVNETNNDSVDNSFLTSSMNEGYKEVFEYKDTDKVVADVGLNSGKKSEFAELVTILKDVIKKDNLMSTDLVSNGSNSSSRKASKHSARNTMTRSASNKSIKMENKETMSSNKSSRKSSINSNKKSSKQTSIESNSRSSSKKSLISDLAVLSRNSSRPTSSRKSSRIDSRIISRTNSNLLLDKSIEDISKTTPRSESGKDKRKKSEDVVKKNLDLKEKGTKESDINMVQTNENERKVENDEDTVENNEFKDGEKETEVRIRKNENTEENNGTLNSNVESENNEGT